MHPHITSQGPGMGVNGCRVLSSFLLTSSNSDPDGIDEFLSELRESSDFRPEAGTEQNRLLRTLWVMSSVSSRLRKEVPAHGVPSSSHYHPTGIGPCLETSRLHAVSFSALLVR